MKLTIAICTHNRAELLARTLGSLNQATRPHDCDVEVLVIANACTDGSAAFLRSYSAQMNERNWLRLRWEEEPTPGKSYALNRAIPLMADGIVAFVDDDHRVDRNYLVSIAEAHRKHPHASLLCGRILPDWDGREPGWVHDTGPYRVYPLPVPRYDQGSESHEITPEGPVPGGGNLCLRREVFSRVDGFATDLGPHGHDLGGGEDSDFVYRCLAAGERIQYVPEILQYHYVDPERLRLGYLLRKSFQRSRSTIRVRSRLHTSIPLYMWRKLAGYMLQAVFCLGWAPRRFYLIRLAAALGEVRGFRDQPQFVAQGAPAVRKRAHQSSVVATALLAGFAILGLGVSSSRPAHELIGSVVAIGAVAVAFAFALVVKSLNDFSRTGPELQEGIRRHFLAYSVWSLLRLSGWAFLLCSAMGAIGFVVYTSSIIAVSATVQAVAVAAAAITAILLLTALQFCRHLLYLPGSIAASYHYRLSRLYPLWQRLSPARLSMAHGTMIAIVALSTTAGAAQLLMEGKWESVFAGCIGGTLAWAFIRWSASAAPSLLSERSSRNSAGKPNILMIGSDTLRADRLGAAGYRRSVTPFIDSLSRGTLFTNCYVPCARTAPSLVSLMTGTWPHTHGIRDNFVADSEIRLQVAALPSVLAQAGYHTAAMSDWSGGDFRKFPLGFGRLDLPDDQWNIKYLIRQGPKDLRLFLSLFTHNRFGKWALPELYYLAGVPLTSLVARDACALISEFAEGSEPFMLNVFISTTHPPFGSEYPYYTLWSDKDYTGESKFVMARLTDPWEIIRRQGDSKKEFDLDQIIDLYDGCVRNFDDEAKRILEHLRACGLEDNTIIVIYSDHGMEFFEHGTWGQGNSVRGDYSARVPLVIADPRLSGEAHCSHIVRSIDVAPTLLELAGIAPPESMDGVSLVPYLKGEATDMNLAAYNETGIWLTDVPGMPVDHLRYPNLLELLEVPDKRTGTLAIKPEYQQAIITAKDRMVRVGPWKLIYQPTSGSPLYELFNLDLDPDCRHDVASEHPEIFRELRDLLMHWMVGGRTAASMPEDKAAAAVG